MRSTRRAGDYSVWSKVPAAAVFETEQSAGAESPDWNEEFNAASAAGDDICMGTAEDDRAAAGRGGGDKAFIAAFAYAAGGYGDYYGSGADVDAVSRRCGTGRFVK